MLNTRTASFAAALLLAPAVLAAQPVRQAGSGTRVRITAPLVEREAGTLVALTADSLVFVRERAPGDTVAVSLERLQRFELSRGRMRDTWRGAGIGAAAGAVVGAVVGAMDYRSCEGAGSFGCFDLGPIGNASATAMLGAAAGGVVGGIIGSMYVSEHWRRIPVAVVLAPAPRGRFALAAAVPLRGW